MEKNYIDEAARRIDLEGAGFAIWLIENAISASQGREAELKRIEDFCSQRIGEKEIQAARKKTQSSLEHVLQMLDHPVGMDGDEWMLIITHISSAEALKRFAKRSNTGSEIPLLDMSLKQLAAATDNYANPSFRLQLHEALGRHPHLPLPPTLLA